MAWLIALLVLLSVNTPITHAVEYTLDGAAYIVYSASAKAFSKTDSTIHMLFRTAETSGILLHARGTDGDFVTLEIVRGKLRYASVFGRGGARPGTHDVTVGDDLGDDQWHQIDLERYNNHVVIKLDMTRKYLTAERVQIYQNINQDITVAGLQGPHTTDNPRNLSIPSISFTGSTFKGCMEDITFNKINIFKATKEKSKYVTVLGTLRPKCADDAEYYPPATLTKSTSFIKLGTSNGQHIDLRFKFRAFDHTGVIVYYNFGSNSKGQLFLELIQGKLRLSFDFHKLNINAIITPKYSTFANGLWHEIHLNLTSKGVAVKVNNDSTEKLFNDSGINLQNPKLKIGAGGYPGKSSLRGCFKEIQLSGKDIEVTKAMSQDVVLHQCYLNDVCFTNPCLHNGVCTQNNGVVRCNCTITGYYGTRCENISAIPASNPTSTRKTSSYIDTKASTILAATIRPSRTISKAIKTISETTTPDSLPSLSTSTTQKLPTTSPSTIKPTTIHLTKSTNLKFIKNSSQTQPKLVTTTSRPQTSTAQVQKSIIPTNKRIIPSHSKQSTVPRSAQTSTAQLKKPTSGHIHPSKSKQSTISMNVQTSTAQLKQSTEPTSKKILTSQAKQSTISVNAENSTAKLKQSSSMVTQVSITPTTKCISSSPIFRPQPTHSVRPTLPTPQKPTHQINTQVIIIKKTNTVNNVGFTKNQLLVYLFLLIVFILFVSLIVIISVKMSYIQACPCIRRLQTASGSLRSQDSIELGQQDSKEPSRGDNQRRVKSGRPSSLNDSGIDRSDSGTDSHRSSAEVQDKTIGDRGDLETSLEDDAGEGFLILQLEDPALYTQQSFGWTALNSTNTIRLCRTSTRDLIHAGNENKPRAFRPAYYPNSELSDDVVPEDDVTNTRYRNPSTKYRQLATSDCSSLDNESIDLEQSSVQDLEGTSQDCVETRDECPVF